jgi:hypothetical protein
MVSRSDWAHEQVTGQGLEYMVRGPGPGHDLGLVELELVQRELVERELVERELVELLEMQ